MSISTIVSYGYGSWGDVSKLPTLGFDITAVVAPTVPGLEYNSPNARLEYNAQSCLLEYKAKSDD
jgi:hypothetical protein